MSYFLRSFCISSLPTSVPFPIPSSYLPLFPFPIFPFRTYLLVASPPSFPLPFPSFPSTSSLHLSFSSSFFQHNTPCPLPSSSVLLFTFSCPNFTFLSCTVIPSAISSFLFALNHNSSISLLFSYFFLFTLLLCRFSMSFPKFPCSISSAFFSPLSCFLVWCLHFSPFLGERFVHTVDTVEVMLCFCFSGGAEDSAH